MRASESARSSGPSRVPSRSSSPRALRCCRLGAYAERWAHAQDMAQDVLFALSLLVLWLLFLLKWITTLHLGFANKARGRSMLLVWLVLPRVIAASEAVPDDRLLAPECQAFVGAMNQDLSRQACADDDELFALDGELMERTRYPPFPQALPIENCATLVPTVSAALGAQPSLGCLSTLTPIADLLYFRLGVSGQMLSNTPRSPILTSVLIIARVILRTHRSTGGSSLGQRMNGR